MTKINFIKLREKANISKMYINDACFDISAATSGKTMHIDPGRWSLIDTGIVLNLPFGVEAQIRPKSGIALKHGVTVLNSPGTIDPGFRGEIKVILINHGTKRFFINDGDRIAQIAFRRIKMVELVESSLSDIDDSPNPEPQYSTDANTLGTRGTNGFGSSGIS